ncbi:MAG: metallophosphoesterase [Anaerostipes sp.]|nr:metallophosphoesterase [Anaerostipes sp.]MDD4370585.1 metallophosphoesterase [Anaerostipes sp.]
MRILVISDSHGRNDDVKGVLEQVGDIDMLIHCGDVERGDNYIREWAGCPVVMVAGNNDYYLDLPSQEIVEVEGYRILVTHGHTYYVNSGVDYLEEYARQEGCNVAMYGHTHVPFIDIGNDMTILNPGSISYPRQQGRKPTFLIMEIDQEGQAHYAHGYYREHFRELDI